MSNLNEIATVPFNEDFCAILEYHLSKAFANSSTNKFEQFWCDGVAIPELVSQLTIPNIIATKQIVTKAWMGLNGQDVYEMTIKLGLQSIKNYVKNIPLTDCLPDTKNLDWLTLDMDAKTIELRLK